VVAALATMGGGAGAGPLRTVVAPVLSLLFLAVTTALLVLDLKRPERFLYLLFKPNGRSWLVWGGYILMAHGLLAVVWLLAGLRRDSDALVLLAVPVGFVMLASAGYSAFLFGQAEGRDFWQSPLVLPHLLLGPPTPPLPTLLLPPPF